MDHATQVGLATRLLELAARDEIELGPAVHRNPVDVYTRRDRLTLEIERLFRAGPLFAGLSCEVASPGDYFTFDAAGVPVLVVRGDDGELRALRNACRHRGAPVASGRGRVGHGFVCPYHAWSYDRSGRLLGASHPQSFPDLDPAETGLVPLPVGERHGLIYLRPSPGGAVDVALQLGGLERELAPFGFAGWHFVEERQNARAMNWKLVMDTFMEAYHLQTLHRRSIAPVFQGQLALFEAFGPNGRLMAARRSIHELRERPERDWRVLPHVTLLYFLFPNTVFIHQQDHVECRQIYPDLESPERSSATIRLYAPTAPGSERQREHLRRNLDLLLEVTNAEDFALGERIQRSFRARAGEHLLYGRNEPALTHYHQSLELRLEGAWR